jgi:NAD(P)-dependent dehydrogenase (short-subunit alcohol dehydrogenase family)
VGRIREKEGGEMAGTGGRRLDGKVAIITGAASGIGRAAALLFARERARVTVADIDARGGEAIAGDIRDAGGDAIFVRTDVTVAAEARAMVDATVHAFGRLDILYNNAGIVRLGGVEEISEDDWDLVMDVNLKSVFVCSKYAIPHMKRAGGGSIINAGSTVSFVGSPRSAPYCASKGGLLILTKQMAIDCAPFNIRVNAICPGVTDTPFAAQVLAASPDPAEARRRSEQARPIGRFAKPEEVARAALFLASDDSSLAMGSALVIDGGYTAQ